MGITLLFVIALMPDYLENHPYLLIPLFLLRCTFLQSTYPIEESVLMDNVPKDQRGRWKSLESVSSFGWSGSAALGGYLASKYDYTFTFIITASIQTIGNLFLILLMPLVPKDEKKVNKLQTKVADSKENKEVNGISLQIA